MAEEARTNRADFDALLRRAGLTFDRAKADELFGAYASLEMLLARITETPRGFEGTKVGQKRATTYFVGGGAPKGGSARTRARAKSGKATSGKKARRGASCSGG